MSKAGFRMILALSGEEALENLNAEPADLIILDMILPGISGLDVCKQIRQSAIFKDIPVIMLTNMGEESYIVAGQDLKQTVYGQPFNQKCC
ncbi:MAG: response regulator [Desulfurivibrio sp.]|nr:response regulator [Desulfurivibrio sp.]